LLKELHKGREEIQQLSGYPSWPDRQPSFDEFIDILIQGFRYPCFVRAITRVAARHVSSARKRKEFNFFKPFQASSQHAVAEASEALGRRWPEGDGEEMRQLAEMGHLDVALGRMFFRTLGTGANSEYLQVARRRQGELASIIPFLEAAEKHLRDGDFDWQRDVIGSRGTPAAIQKGDTEVGPVPQMPPQTGDTHRVPNEVRKLNSIKTSDAPPVTAPAPPERKPSPARARSEARRVAQGASRATWDSAIGEIIHLAQAAVGCEPSLNILSRLVAALKTARSAHRAWESSKPVLVNTAQVADEAQRLTAILADLAEQSIPAFPAIPASITSEAAEEATTALTQAHDAVDAAEALRKEAKELMASGDLRKLDAVMAIKGQLRTVASDGLDTLGRAIAILAEGAPPNMPAQVMAEAQCPHVPSIMPESAGVGAPEDAEDDAALELLSEPAEPESELSDGPTEVPSAPEPIAEVPGPDDPFAEEVERKLVALFSRQEFGLAYHLLRAARRVFPDHPFSFTEAELRLAAMSGHNNHAGMQGSELLGRLLTQALDVAEELRTAADDSSRQDMAVARAIVLHAVLCPLALFHPASPAVQVLQTLGGVIELQGDGLRALSDAIVEAAHSGLPLTTAALRSAGQESEAEARRYGDERRDAVLAKIRFISDLRFPFQLGIKVRALLTSNEGAVGALRLAVERDGTAAIDAARAFASRYSERSGIRGLVEQAEAQLSSRRGMDGAGRERLLGNIIELSALCDEFVEARNAAPVLRNPTSKARMLAIREALCSSADRAIRALGSSAERWEPLTPAAVKFAIPALQRFKATAQGQRLPPPVIDHLLAVHAPLLWLSGLHFGRSWLPSPYQPERVVETILRAPDSVVPRGADPEAPFEAVVCARKEEGSFVAARLLIDVGSFFGAPESQRARLMESLEADVQTRRGALERTIEDVRRRVDRMERMGHLISHDDAERLVLLLDQIVPAKLPADLSLDYRSEDEEGEQILDFCSAESLLDDVRAQANALLEKPRREILSNLDRLSATGRISSHDIERIRGLVLQQDDLLTAREWMDFLETGRGLPETPSPNPRFHAFFPVVPDVLARMSRDEAPAVADHIREGSDLGPLAFSRIQGSRRQDAVELFESWLTLRHRVQGGAVVENMPSLMAHFLDRAGLAAVLNRPDMARSNARRKTYVTEMQLRIPTDADSVLLPDFGSVTRGNYRVCAVATVPSPSEISTLCDGAGSLGVIVLVMELIDAERRRNMNSVLVKQSTRVLVIDEAVFLFALSEQEFRPLTLIECAQPFSFAAPYRDYGNAAVPPEMFFGREAEQRKIYEPFGSCIVYGGRRLGKTALLRHVQATKHDPKNGVVVAYVNILDVGNNTPPSRIWEYASRELKPVFTSSVSSADDFAAGLRRWLDADTKRRVLVLFDESDRFIESDERDGFREFIRLQALMDTTGRRFKMVLAGLHNVTRLVQTENPPLKQIAADPLRIGPLMDDELKEAELLVTRPLSAMGFEFENRGDAWRILSHCNYYPVLVQTFCEGLVADLQKEVIRRQRPVHTITGDHVRRALDNEHLIKLIGEKFDYTISKIDPRYELIACIMADRAIAERDAGRIDEGISAVEVRDRAIEHWPAAFDKVNRLSVIEDLLDEMEGLGVLRRVPGDRWALRSQTILRLLGNKERIEAKLYDEFIGRPAPQVLELGSLRRPLHDLVNFPKLVPGYLCPLTMGQEHDLLSWTLPGEAPIRIIFGNELSDQALVATALSTAIPVAADGSRILIKARAWTSIEGLMDEVRQVSSNHGKSLLVVDSRSQWDGNWVEQALKARPVRENLTHIAFAGGPQHAMRWIMDVRFRPLPSQVRMVLLEPWSNVLVDHRLLGENLPTEEFRDALRQATGGFNRLMCQAFGQSTNRDRFAARLKAMGERLLAAPDLIKELGLVRPMDEIFRHASSFADGSGRITPYEIDEGVLVSIKAAPRLTAQQVVDFGVMMGLLVPEPPQTGAGEEFRPHAFNPLAAAALKLAQSGTNV
jgi:hypothetical protein